MGADYSWRKALVELNAASSAIDLDTRQILHNVFTPQTLAMV